MGEGKKEGKGGEGRRIIILKVYNATVTIINRKSIMIERRASQMKGLDVCHLYVVPGHTPLPSGHTPLAPGHTPLAPGHTPLAPGHTPLAPGHTPLAPGHTPTSTRSHHLAPGHTPLAPGYTPLAPGQKNTCVPCIVNTCVYMYPV